MENRLSTRLAGQWRDRRTVGYRRNATGFGPIGTVSDLPALVRTVGRDRTIALPQCRLLYRLATNLDLYSYVQPRRVHPLRKKPVADIQSHCGLRQTTAGRKFRRGRHSIGYDHPKPTAYRIMRFAGSDSRPISSGVGHGPLYGSLYLVPGAGDPRHRDRGRR